MKYLLKQNKEDKGILCDKVTIDGFDYYVTDGKRALNDFVHLDNTIKELPDYNGNHIIQLLDETLLNSANALNCKKVIATNDSNIDIPQVVDDVEDLDILKSKWYDNQEEDRSEAFVFQYSGIVDDALEKGIIIGYNKSQEMFPFTEEDMIEFAKYYKVITCNCKGEPPHPNKNSKPDNSLEVHLQIWKEQQPKIIYYEN